MNNQVSIPLFLPSNLGFVKAGGQMGGEVLAFGRWGQGGRQNAEPAPQPEPQPTFSAFSGSGVSLGGQAAAPQ